MILIAVIYIKEDNKRIVNKIENCYNNNEQISEKFIKEAENNIDKEIEIKNSNDYFILGYINSKYYNNQSLAKNYFEKAIKYSDKETYVFSRLYSYYYLTEDAIKNKNIDNAIYYAQKSFDSLSPYEYDRYEKIIWGTFRNLINSKKGSEVALKDYNKIKKYENLLCKESKFYVYKRIAILNTLLCKYTNAVEASLNEIELAIQMEKREDLYTSIMDLGLVAKEAGQYNIAIKIINSTNTIKIDDKKDEANLNYYKFISLANIENVLENEKNALDYLNQINKYEKYIDKNKIDHLNVIKNLIESEYYAEKGNFKLANNYLKKSKDIQCKYEYNYYEEKWFMYYKALAKIYDKENKYGEAIDIYKQIYELAKQKENIEYVEFSLEKLQYLYYKVGDYKKTYETSQNLLKLRNRKNNIFAKYFYENIFNKYYNDITKQENTNIKIMNLFFKLIILILIVIIFIFNIYPSISKYMLKRKIKEYIKEDKYILYYQPIINPKNNKIMGLEALLRLKLHDDIIMPNKILSDIENCDMMDEVSVWILKKIMKDYKEIKEIDNISDKFYISMNISLKEVEDDKIIEAFNNLVKKSNIRKKSICMEITETFSYQEQNKVRENINKLRECGFLIALDDFGVDYSNVSILDKFKFDTVKLDKYFIDNIKTSDINKTVIEMADYLSIAKDKTIVIEGVEELFQMEIIKKTLSNKFYIQGYFYSKPLELEDLKNFRLNK